VTRCKNIFVANCCSTELTTIQFKPPHILFLTPSGRFETGKKICLSFSAFHPELWQPAWGIRLILEALIAFLPTPADGAIGSLDWTSTERKRLAKKSVSFCCPRCGNTADLLPELKEDGDNEKQPSRFQKEIEQLQLAQAANEAKQEDKKPKTESENEDALGENEVEEVANSATDKAVQCSVITDRKKNETVETKAEQTVEQIEDIVANIEHNVITPEPGTPENNVHLPRETIPDVNEVGQETVVQQDNPYLMDVSWLTEPMLNFSIVLLSGICVLLFGKAYSLAEELLFLTNHIQM